MHPYNSIDTIAAWKKLRFRSDFQMTDSLLIAVYAFVSRVSMSVSVNTNFQENSTVIGSNTADQGGSGCNVNEGITLYLTEYQIWSLTIGCTLVSYQGHPFWGWWWLAPLKMIMSRYSKPHRQGSLDLAKHLRYGLLIGHRFYMISST